MSGRVKGSISYQAPGRRRYRRACARFVISFLSFALLGPLLFAPVEARDPGEAIRLLTQAATADPGNEAIFKAYLQTLPRDSRGNYFLEGDLAATEEDVRGYMENRASALSNRSQELDNSELKLALNPETGEQAHWPRGERALTFTVDPTTFQGAGAEERMEQALDALTAGAADWERACPECGISFQFVERVAAGSFFENVTFILEYDNNPFGPIARAFFPYEPKSAKRVVVFPAFYSPSLNFSKEGVMRHELGHVLGYRHEHIEDIPGCFFENDNWLRITDYDPTSAMHYLCGDGGSNELQLSEKDLFGHRCVYVHDGPPCPGD